MLRLFIAVNLDEELLAAMTALQNQLKRRLSNYPLRWSRAQGIHLTLKFLGDTDPARVPDLHAALLTVVQEQASFALRVAGLGCFPNMRRPSVLWVGVQDPEKRLQRLAAMVDTAVAELGWPPEKRPFTGHLTLARVSRSANAYTRRDLGAALARMPQPASLGMCRVDAIHIMRSQLHPQGAIYTRLHSLPLQGAESRK